MVKRDELSDQQWRKVAKLVPGKIGDPGRSGDDNRRFMVAYPWDERETTDLLYEFRAN